MSERNLFIRSMHKQEQWIDPRTKQNLSRCSLQQNLAKSTDAHFNPATVYDVLVLLYRPRQFSQQGMHGASHILNWEYSGSRVVSRDPHTPTPGMCEEHLAHSNSGVISGQTFTRSVSSSVRGQPKFKQPKWSITGIHAKFCTV